MKARLVLGLLMLGLCSPFAHSFDDDICDMTFEEEDDQELELSHAEQEALARMMQAQDVWWRRVPSAVAQRLFMLCLRGYSCCTSASSSICKHLNHLLRNGHGKKKTKPAKA